VLRIYNTLIRLLWPLLYLYPPFRGTIHRRLGHFATGNYRADAEGLNVLINAVSAGEVVAISSFIRQLRESVAHCNIVLLTTTESGQSMAASKLKGLVDLQAYFPLVDHPLAVKRYLDKLLPDLYITTEAELWPNIQSECRERGIPVCLVNGRLYLHNKTGLRRIILQQLIELCDLIVTQDKTHWLNYIKFAIPPERLISSGNIKFDFELEHWGEGRMNRERRALGLSDEPVITAGSTHQGEEEIAIDCLAQARLENPACRLILAPRHIERVEEVVKLLQKHRLRVRRLGEKGKMKPWDVLVVDRYGVLVDMYRFADVVLMGGTFNEKVGGHNILEATVLGKPVVVGPHTYGISAQMEMLRREKAVIETDREHAGAVLLALLNSIDERIRIGNKGRELTMQNRGAAQRAVDAVLECYKRLSGDSRLQGRTKAALLNPGDAR
jgi:3-deoxy-D-manno-octulosonic-acid transferase